MVVQRLLTRGVVAVAVIVGFLAAGAAQAASVSLTPGSQTVTEGDTFALTLAGDFPDGIIGGGISTAHSTRLNSRLGGDLRA